MAVVIFNSRKTVQIDYAWIFCVKKEKFIEVKILQLLSSWKRVEASYSLGILFSGNLFAIYSKTLFRCHFSFFNSIDKSVVILVTSNQE